MLKNLFTMTIDDLEKEIGIVPWTGNKPMLGLPGNMNFPGNNHDYILHIRQWLALKGIPKQKIENMKWESVQASYASRPYFDTVIGNRPRKLNQSMSSLIGTPEKPITLEEPIQQPDWDDSRSKTDLESKTTRQIKSENAELGLELEFSYKFAELKADITRDTNNLIIENAQRLSQEFLTVLTNFRKDLITEKTSIEEELKTKIFSLVQKSAEETLFHLLPGKQQDLPLGDLPPPVSYPQESERDSPESDPNSSLIPISIPDFYFDPVNTKYIRLAIKLGHNFLISGPTGCGKTELPNQICSKLGLPLATTNAHGDLTKNDFIGTIDVKNAETIYRYGILPRAMKGGYGLIIDEIDFMPPHIGAMLHPVLQHGGKLYIPETGEYISPKKGFFIGATCNTGGKGDSSGMYSGTEVLNLAFLDRFSLRLEMDYMPYKKEQDLLTKRHPSINPDQIKKILNLSTEIRRGFSQGQISSTLTTRKILDLFTYVENGLTIYQALQPTLVNWFDAEDRPIVETIMQRLQIKDEGEIP